MKGFQTNMVESEENYMLWKLKDDNVDVMNLKAFSLVRPFELPIKKNHHHQAHFPRVRFSKSYSLKQHLQDNPTHQCTMKEESGFIMVYVSFVGDRKEWRIKGTCGYRNCNMFQFNIPNLHCATVTAELERRKYGGHFKVVVSQFDEFLFENDPSQYTLVNQHKRVVNSRRSKSSTRKGRTPEERKDMIEYYESVIQDIQKKRQFYESIEIGGTTYKVKDCVRTNNDECKNSEIPATMGRICSIFSSKKGKVKKVLMQPYYMFNTIESKLKQGQKRTNKNKDILSDSYKVHENELFESVSYQWIVCKSSVIIEKIKICSEREFITLGNNNKLNKNTYFSNHYFDSIKNSATTKQYFSENKNKNDNEKDNSKNSNESKMNTSNGKKKGKGKAKKSKIKNKKVNKQNKDKEKANENDGENERKETKEGEEECDRYFDVVEVDGVNYFVNDDVRVFNVNIDDDEDIVNGEEWIGTIDSIYSTKKDNYRTKSLKLKFYLRFDEIKNQIKNRKRDSIHNECVASSKYKIHDQELFDSLNPPKLDICDANLIFYKVTILSKHEYLKLESKNKLNNKMYCSDYFFDYKIKGLIPRNSCCNVSDGNEKNAKIESDKNDSENAKNGKNVNNSNCNSNSNTNNITRKEGEPMTIDNSINMNDTHVQCKNSEKSKDKSGQKRLRIEETDVGFNLTNDLDTSVGGEPLKKRQKLCVKRKEKTIEYSHDSGATPTTGSSGGSYNYNYSCRDYNCNSDKNIASGHVINSSSLINATITPTTTTSAYYLTNDTSIENDGDREQKNKIVEDDVIMDDIGIENRNGNGNGNGNDSPHAQSPHMISSSLIENECTMFNLAKSDITECISNENIYCESNASDRVKSDDFEDCIEKNAILKCQNKTNVGVVRYTNNCNNDNDIENECHSETSRIQGKNIGNNSDNNDDINDSTIRSSAELCTMLNGSLQVQGGKTKPNIFIINELNLNTVSIYIVCMISHILTHPKNKRTVTRSVHVGSSTVIEKLSLPNSQTLVCF